MMRARSSVRMSRDLAILRIVIHVPFGGLFQGVLPLQRGFDRGLRWDFPGPDLNTSAKAMFRHLDRIFEVLNAREFAFLSTIELDMGEGRFPEVLAQYFRDEAWADARSFLVAPGKNAP